MPSIPLFGTGVSARSANVNAQRRINMYVEAGGDDKDGFVLYSRPGLSAIFNTDPDDDYGGGPIRGCIAVNYVYLAGTASQRLRQLVFGGISKYSIVSVENPAQFLTSRPTEVFSTVEPPLVYADDGVQIMCVDGKTAYVSVYTVGTVTQSELSTLGVTTFPFGAKTICSIGSRFVCDDPAANGRFRWSGLLSYTDWNALNYATAESIPDALVGVYSFRGELLLFGAQSLEFWGLSGGTDVFARIGGSGTSWGLVSYQTIQPVDDVLFFVGRRGGGMSVCVLSGYQVQTVSTPDIEYDLNANEGEILSALVIRTSGHTFYILNTPRRSWVYNVGIGEWSEWQTDGGRFAGQYAFYAYNRLSITDYRDSRIYTVVEGSSVDDGEPILREVQTKHLTSDMDRMTLWDVTLDVETGVGLSEGQGSDPQVMLQVSRDGGHTFGVEMWQSLGALGQYAKRAVWRRLGLARDLVLRFRVTDAVKVVFMGASIRLEK